MGLSINTNYQSLFAQRSLSTNSISLGKSVQKLATGLRINHAADDAAGLAVSEKLSSIVRGFEKAQQNTLDGISMLQTAEGGLLAINDNLQRIRELVVQASNGTNGADERSAIQAEIDLLNAGIDDYATETEFNDTKLLNSTATSFILQTGVESGDTTTVDIEFDARHDQTGAGTINEGAAVSLDAIDVTTGLAADYTNALSALDTVIGNVSEIRSKLGASQNSLEAHSDYVGIAIENVATAKSRILDTDIAKESSNLIKFQILTQSASAMLGQANLSPQVTLGLLGLLPSST
jgi:flagellin